jgi:hypothetical protein
MLVTVGIPGTPDVHEKNEDAQVRRERAGYIHSARVDGGGAASHRGCGALAPADQLS